MQFDNVDSALMALKNGETAIVVDDENRENEGDLAAVTEWVNNNTIDSMAKEARGLICAPVSKGITQRLDSVQMVDDSSDIFGTQFIASIDHVDTTTGISAYERTLTVKKLIGPSSGIKDFSRPGHLFPLVVQDKGVLARSSHTEAVVDLARLTSAKPVGVICEAMNGDDMMAKGQDLQKFKGKHKLKMITTGDLIEHHKELEPEIEFKAKVKMPTNFGTFNMYGSKAICTNEGIVVLTKGAARQHENVRLHSACLVGDILHSQRCDCGTQLGSLMKYTNEHGGMTTYLPQEGRGIGLLSKLRAYELIEQGYDIVAANLALDFDEDLRDYYVVIQIPEYPNIEHIDLLSNNSSKFEGLKQYGIDITERIEAIVPGTVHNHNYMETKKTEMGYLI